MKYQRVSKKSVFVFESRLRHHDFRDKRELSGSRFSFCCTLIVLFENPPEPMAIFPVTLGIGGS